ncbi:hypothetical protein IQ07DRAFT_664772 [Pyrenochaeta sp. DS3sAY3a]|nr:hypothetical protein IQ07DRAFT_664772 [Pyrenochaeta sp. DS3sAY3a]
MRHSLQTSATLESLTTDSSLSDRWGQANTFPHLKIIRAVNFSSLHRVVVTSPCAYISSRRTPFLDPTPPHHHTRPTTYLSTHHNKTTTKLDARPPHTMCQTLYQIYACGHDKPICTTPCLNVLKSQATGGLEHQDSVHRSDSQRQNIASTAMASEQEQEHETHVPAFRFVTSAVSTSTSTTPTSTPTIPTPTPRSPAPPSPSQPQPLPCEKPRDLSPSIRPCLACYVKPEYAALRQNWMDVYRREHPLGRSEEVGERSGVEELVRMSEKGELRAWKRGRVCE